MASDTVMAPLEVLLGGALLIMCVVGICTSASAVVTYPWPAHDSHRPLRRQGRFFTMSTNKAKVLLARLLLGATIMASVAGAYALASVNDFSLSVIVLVTTLSLYSLIMFWDPTTNEVLKLQLATIFRDIDQINANIEVLSVVDNVQSDSSSTLHAGPTVQEHRCSVSQDDLQKSDIKIQKLQQDAQRNDKTLQRGLRAILDCMKKEKGVSISKDNHQAMDKVVDEMLSLPMGNPMLKEKELQATKKTVNDHNDRLQQLEKQFTDFAAASKDKLEVSLAKQQREMQGAFDRAVDKIKREADDRVQKAEHKAKEHRQAMAAELAAYQKATEQAAVNSYTALKNEIDESSAKSRDRANTLIRTHVNLQARELEQKLKKEAKIAESRGELAVRVQNLEKKLEEQAVAAMEDRKYVSRIQELEKRMFRREEDAKLDNDVVKSVYGKLKDKVTGLETKVSLQAEQNASQKTQFQDEIASSKTRIDDLETMATTLRKQLQRNSNKTKALEEEMKSLSDDHGARLAQLEQSTDMLRKYVKQHHQHEKALNMMHQSDIIKLCTRDSVKALQMLVKELPKIQHINATNLLTDQHLHLLNGLASCASELDQLLQIRELLVNFIQHGNLIDQAIRKVDQLSKDFEELKTRKIVDVASAPHTSPVNNTKVDVQPADDGKAADEPAEEPAEEPATDAKATDGSFADTDAADESVTNDKAATKPDANAKAKDEPVVEETAAESEATVADDEPNDVPIPSASTEETVAAADKQKEQASQLATSTTDAEAQSTSTTPDIVEVPTTSTEKISPAKHTSSESQDEILASQPVEESSQTSLSIETKTEGMPTSIDTSEASDEPKSADSSDETPPSPTSSEFDAIAENDQSWDDLFDALPEPDQEGASGGITFDDLKFDADAGDLPLFDFTEEDIKNLGGKQPVHDDAENSISEPSTQDDQTQSRQSSDVASQDAPNTIKPTNNDIDKVVDSLLEDSMGGRVVDAGAEPSGQDVVSSAVLPEAEVVEQAPAPVSEEVEEAHDAGEEPSDEAGDDLTSLFEGFDGNRGEDMDVEKSASEPVAINDSGDSQAIDQSTSESSDSVNTEMIDAPAAAPILSKSTTSFAPLDMSAEAFESSFNFGPSQTAATQTPSLSNGGIFGSMFSQLQDCLAAAPNGRRAANLVAAQAQTSNHDDSDSEAGDTSMIDAAAPQATDTANGDELEDTVPELSSTEQISALLGLHSDTEEPPKARKMKIPKIRGGRRRQPMATNVGVASQSGLASDNGVGYTDMQMGDSSAFPAPIATDTPALTDSQVADLSRILASTAASSGAAEQPYQPAQQFETGPAQIPPKLSDDEMTRLKLTYYQLDVNDWRIGYIAAGSMCTNEEALLMNLDAVAPQWLVGIYNIVCNMPGPEPEAPPYNPSANFAQQIPNHTADFGMPGTSLQGYQSQNQGQATQAMDTDMTGSAPYYTSPGFGSSTADFGQTDNNPGWSLQMDGGVSDDFGLGKILEELRKSTSGQQAHGNGQSVTTGQYADANPSSAPTAGGYENFRYDPPTADDPMGFAQPPNAAGGDLHVPHLSAEMESMYQPSPYQDLNAHNVNKPYPEGFLDQYGNIGHHPSQVPHDASGYLPQQPVQPPYAPTPVLDDSCIDPSLLALSDPSANQLSQPPADTSSHHSQAHQIEAFDSLDMANAQDTYGDDAAYFGGDDLQQQHGGSDRSPTPYDMTPEPEFGLPDDGEDALSIGSGAEWEFSPITKPIPDEQAPTSTTSIPGLDLESPTSPPADQQSADNNFGVLDSSRFRNVAPEQASDYHRISVKGAGYESELREAVIEPANRASSEVMARRNIATPRCPRRNRALQPSSGFAQADNVISQPPVPATEQAALSNGAAPSQAHKTFSEEYGYPEHAQKRC